MKYNDVEKIAVERRVGGKKGRQLLELARNYIAESGERCRRAEG